MRAAATPVYRLCLGHDSLALPWGALPSHGGPLSPQQLRLAPPRLGGVHRAPRRVREAIFSW